MGNKKLLYVINHIDWFWSHRLPLAQGAQCDGWTVSVAVTGAKTEAKLRPTGFKGIELPASDQGFAPLTVFKIIWAIHKIIIKEKPDVLHAITLKYAFMAGLAARMHKHLKIVHTIAGLGYLFSGEGLQPTFLRLIVGPFLKIALKHPRAQIIFQNPDDERLMVKRKFVRPSQCHLILGSGVDLEQFRFTTLPEDAVPIVLMPTRLVHDKGIAVFIETARILKTRGVQARFQIAGGVTRNNPLAISEKQMHELIKYGAAEWLGKVDDMAALYRASTLICYPSYYGEGVPKVLLEAAATGRPIITTDHPGCREVVHTGENGLLVPVKDAQATADAIIRLLNDRSLMQKMGQSSRARAEHDFDVKLIVRRTISVYNTALVS
jgi:glycosyltransferase involved in cell wall biosynthesis